jgi:MFS family permease
MHDLGDNSVSYDDIFFVDTAMIYLNLAGYPIGVYMLDKRVNVKLILFIGGAISLSGILISSFTTNMLAFILTYGIMNGIGSGISYMVPMIIAWEYFPERKGLMTGLIVGSYGLGSFVFSFVSEALVNPEGGAASIKEGDISFFKHDIAKNTPFMLRILTLIWSFFVLCGIILIERKPLSDDEVRERAR